MFFNYKDCIERHRNDYFLSKEIKNGKLFKVEKGIYSDSENWSEISLIAYKHSKAVFTLASAFYFQSLTDVIPQIYELGTIRNSTKIKDSRIKQIFYPEKIFEIGVEKIEFLKTPIKVYTKERLLIELIRNRNKLPFDMYKEVINSYRNKILELDIEWIERNVSSFPACERIMNAIKMEVF